VEKLLNYNNCDQKMWTDEQSVHYEHIIIHDIIYYDIIVSCSDLYVYNIGTFINIKLTGHTKYTFLFYCY